MTLEEYRQRIAKLNKPMNTPTDEAALPGYGQMKDKVPDDPNRKEEKPPEKMMTFDEARALANRSFVLGIIASNIERDPLISTTSIKCDSITFECGYSRWVLRIEESQSKSGSDLLDSLRTVLEGARAKQQQEQTKTSS
jgi:hypothetical protein